jgi:hypothetical protein
MDFGAGDKFVTDDPQPVAGEGEATRCSNCGNALNAEHVLGGGFCAECGTKINAPSAAGTSGDEAALRALVTQLGWTPGEFAARLAANECNTGLLLAEMRMVASVADDPGAAATTLEAVTAGGIVREQISTESKEIRKLQVGTIVQVLETGAFQGHQRVR